MGKFISAAICAQVKLPLKESSAAVSTAKAHCDEDESAAVTYYTASVIASPVTVLEPKEEKGIAICPSQKWLSLFFQGLSNTVKNSYLKRQLVNESERHFQQPRRDSQPLESKQQSPPPTQTSSSSSSPPYFECMVRAYTSMTSAYTDEGSLRREVRHHPSTNRDPWTDLVTYLVTVPLKT